MKPWIYFSREGNMTDKTVYVLIPAAGKGERMGGTIPKLLLKVDGVEVIIRTLQAFDRFADSGVDVRAVLITGESLVDDLGQLVKEYGIRCVSGITIGGASRTESVGNGVKYLKGLGIKEDDYIFIHDGARCLVDQEILEDCLKSISEHEVCVASVPVKSTLKICESTPSGEVKVVNTPDRSTIMEVQTPQCFRYGTLVRCYEYAAENNVTATDDTALAEILGIDVYLTKGSYSNIKITTPEDIRIAESITRR